MSLQNEIKQEKFTSEFEKAGLNVLFTGSWLHNLNLNRLKKYGVSPEQYNVLRILRGSHPDAMMLSDIASRMIDRNSNATRLVEKLRLKGLVKREVCETNRRQVDITITSKGLHLLKKVDDHAAEEWTTCLRRISKSEAKELNRLLDKLREG